MVFEEALHTYLDVPDIRTTEVTGLEGTMFYDKLAGPEPVPGDADPVGFRSETDRIYLDTPATTTVRDTESGRAVLIGKAGSQTTVVWNPWIDGARRLRDLGNDEWKRMVCVEVCNVGEAAVALAPGESHTMTATFEVLPVQAADSRTATPGQPGSARVIASDQRRRPAAQETSS